MPCAVIVPEFLLVSALAAWAYAAGGLLRAVVVGLWLLSLAGALWQLRLGARRGAQPEHAWVRVARVTVTS